MNHLLPKQEVSRTSVGTRFYVENQGVFEWAYGEGSDPVVWGRFDDDRDHWQLEREPLSRFLIEALLIEAVLSEHGAQAPLLPETQASRVLAHLHPVPLGSLRWPVEPTRFFAGRDVVAMVCVDAWAREIPTLATGWDITIGARSAAAMEWLDDIVGPPDRSDWAAFSRWSSAP